MASPNDSPKHEHKWDDEEWGGSTCSCGASMDEWGEITEPPQPVLTPTQTPFEFEPEYEKIDDIRHEFTGLLWIPTAEDSEKAAKKQREKDAVTPDLTNFAVPVTTVLTPFPTQWRTRQMGISAQELIRLNATRSK